MGARRARRTGARKALRSAYKLLSILNTATYVLDAGARPGALVKHLLRRNLLKISGRIIR